MDQFHPYFICSIISKLIRVWVGGAEVIPQEVAEVIEAMIDIQPNWMIFVVFLEKQELWESGHFLEEDFVFVDVQKSKGHILFD